MSLFLQKGQREEQGECFEVQRGAPREVQDTQPQTEVQAEASVPGLHRLLKIVQNSLKFKMVFYPFI